MPSSALLSSREEECEERAAGVVSFTPAETNSWEDTHGLRMSRLPCHCWTECVCSCSRLHWQRPMHVAGIARWYRCYGRCRRQQHTAELTDLRGRGVGVTLHPSQQIPFSEEMPWQPSRLHAIVWQLTANSTQRQTVILSPPTSPTHYHCRESSATSCLQPSV